MCPRVSHGHRRSPTTTTTTITVIVIVITIANRQPPLPLVGDANIASPLRPVRFPALAFRSREEDREGGRDAPADTR